MIGIYKFWFGFYGGGMEAQGSGAPPPVGTFRILLETGDKLLEELEENANFLRKEQSS